MKVTLTKTAVMGCALASLFTTHTANARPTRATSGAKYVFFFLGDGMASVQMQAAEAYKASRMEGGEDRPVNLKASVLNMNLLPISGMSTTYSDTRLITDSAAAGTAFACGVKTGTGIIGLNTDKNMAYKSIAELAHEQGKSVGIISSVSLPHATPAAYYANVNSRNNYTEIGYQAALSGFEFFGGGQFRYLNSSDNAGGIAVSEAFENNGYTFVNSIDDLENVSGKVVCSVATSYDSNAMPYDMDTPEGNFTLAEVTEAAINRLQNDADGFFIMVEGGKIDWAGHANDAKATITDTIAFDEAVGEALEFYYAHPNETLIVVTGDHETGGMSIGYKGTKYETAFETLEGQTISYDLFNRQVITEYKNNHTWIDAETSNIDADMIDAISNCFGLVWTDLSEYQQEQLEAAYDRELGNVKADSRPSGYDLDGYTDVDYTIYGGYKAIAVTCSHILNQESGLFWASTSHTAVPVPVMAAGFDAYRFGGFYDNTDIAKFLGQAMRTPALPVEDPDYSGGGLPY
ncbi:alkaline phosphatase [Pontiellaceae bacterium B12219]|nr:alkaline phosphatase [Pontiellaceae bacterium B12219]